MTNFRYTPWGYLLDDDFYLDYYYVKDITKRLIEFMRSHVIQIDIPGLIVNFIDRLGEQRADTYQEFLSDLTMTLVDDLQKFLGVMEDVRYDNMIQEDSDEEVNFGRLIMDEWEVLEETPVSFSFSAKKVTLPMMDGKELFMNKPPNVKLYDPKSEDRIIPIYSDIQDIMTIYYIMKGYYFLVFTCAPSDNITLPLDCFKESFDSKTKGTFNLIIQEYHNQVYGKNLDWLFYYDFNTSFYFCKRNIEKDFINLKTKMDVEKEELDKEKKVVELIDQNAEFKPILVVESPLTRRRILVC
jgi:hypothetical protein